MQALLTCQPRLGPELILSSNVPSYLAFVYAFSIGEMVSLGMRESGSPKMLYVPILDSAVGIFAFLYSSDILAVLDKFIDNDDL